jgi:hypothetical protein
MATRKGLWIALGSCGFLVLAAVAIVGVIAFSVLRHLDVSRVSAASAEREHARLRDRFTGQTPLLQIDKDHPENIEVHRAAERVSQGSITALHIFAWNPRDGKVVKLDLPFWLLRLQSRSESVNWNWNGEELSFDNVRISIKDLERHGPGLILDFEGRGGQRVLLWSE